MFAIERFIHEFYFYGVLLFVTGFEIEACYYRNTYKLHLLFH
jgi:hypothetical protein